MRQCRDCYQKLTSKIEAIIGQYLVCTVDDSIVYFLHKTLIMKFQITIRGSWSIKCSKERIIVYKKTSCENRLYLVCIAWKLTDHRIVCQIMVISCDR